MKSWREKAVNVNLSVFSNHHTIIGGCTAPVSDARQFIVELAGVFLYHYIVLCQDPSGNEQRALSPILSHCFENKRERTSHRALLQTFHQEYLSQIIRASTNLDRKASF